MIMNMLLDSTNPRASLDDRRARIYGLDVMAHNHTDDGGTGGGGGESASEEPEKEPDAEVEIDEKNLDAEKVAKLIKDQRAKNAENVRIKKERDELAAWKAEQEKAAEESRIAKLEEVEREKELRVKAEQALIEKDAQLARAERLRVVADAQVVEEYRDILEARLAAEMSSKEDLDIKAFLEDQKIRYPAIFKDSSTATAGGPQGRGNSNVIEQITNELKTERSEAKRMELALRLKAAKRKAAAS